MADAHNVNHDYHILDPSPWPFIGGVGAFTTAVGAVAYMRYLNEDSFAIAGVNIANPWLLFVGLLIVLYTMFAWWKDTIKESHEEYIGGQWPPPGIEVLDPFHLPLFNTVILLLSGTTVTWAHHSLMHNDRGMLKAMLALTVVLGIIFSGVQAYEYAHAPFAFKESIYGATFFMATGFHGFHVLVGTIFLIVCLIRAMAGHFRPEKHFGFEAAAWYWHFVDVVWLFLFFAVYVWASWGAAVH